MSTSIESINTEADSDLEAQVLHLITQLVALVRQRQRPDLPPTKIEALDAQIQATRQLKAIFERDLYADPVVAEYVPSSSQSESETESEVDVDEKKSTPRRQRVTKVSKSVVVSTPPVKTTRRKQVIEEPVAVNVRTTTTFRSHRTGCGCPEESSSNPDFMKRGRSKRLPKPQSYARRRSPTPVSESSDLSEEDQSGLDEDSSEENSDRSDQDLIRQLAFQYLRKRDQSLLRSAKSEKHAKQQMKLTRHPISKPRIPARRKADSSEDETIVVVNTVPNVQPAPLEDETPNCVIA